MRPAAQEPATLSALGRAGALIGSARGSVFDVLGDLTATVQAGEPPSLDQRAHWAGCVVNTMTACREAVELLVDAVGAPALAHGSELGRRLRDTTMLAQHGMAHQRVLRWSGGLYLGQEPPTPAY